MAEDFETVELEYSEDDILYYIEDEDGVEVGFALEEDGVEVEYYYEGFDADDYVFAEEAEDPAPAPAPSATKPKVAEAIEEPVDHGYLYKMATIVGHTGNKTRKKAEVQLDKVRDKAEVTIDKAKDVATEKAGHAKTKADEMHIGFTREDVEETTADLNAIAKEGAEAAKELKEAYDDIMENFGMFVPKKIRRRLP